MKNKIEDLKNHLFAQLERLSEDEDMKNPIKLERELKRAKAISEVSQVLVSAAKAEIDFIKTTGKVNDTIFMRIDKANTNTKSLPSNT
ncbi:MAG: hypothetical protein ACK52I_22335 [Pseudomonadota bacterium]|jgi:hypothetical protein